MKIKYRKIFDDLFKAFIYFNAAIGVIVIFHILFILSVPSYIAGVLLENYTDSEYGGLLMLPLFVIVFIYYFPREDGS